ncbi:hypothetical protein [Aequorivita marina]|uniref:hypothetical protein n=1 Tax=Aequorivita marina TaxID=3073654 RepID=UPI0028750F92|nr:hypothetical protein [Aequorivita sp. S2608]MDS1299272.1 hypothetical protein [Aequorivita sp. S2608]
MKIILRKQYVNYEPNEYEFFGPVTIERIKLEFENFPWEDQIKLQEQLIGFHISPSFNLEYKNKELTITGYQNDNFSIRYNHRDILQWQFQANMFNMSEVLYLIDQFTILKPKQFKKILATKSTVEESLLSIFFITLNYNRKKHYSAKLSQVGNTFKINFKRLLYYFVFSFIWLLLPLILFLFLGTKFEVIPFLIFQSLCILLAIPGIIISLNHLTYNGKLKLVFKKGENIFEVINDSQSILFNKKDVLKIVEIRTDGGRAPWSIYEYYIILFKNGSELWVSNILIGASDIYNQFYFVEKESKHAWIPLLKKTLVFNIEQ